MKFYSTKDKTYQVDLKTAVLQSLPPDNGLYMPEFIPRMSEEFFDSLENMTFSELAFEIAHPYLSETFEDTEIKEIVDNAINFGAPLTSLSDQLHILELWHGPSLAFKDFGARFMAEIMSRLVKGEERKLTILVATSGDTGGAVAAGFLGVENVEVIILYPSEKVSPLQEKQLTTLGQNIKALEIDGSFDDCQAIVKEAFLDPEINEHYLLSSANSINISRLIPQTFYYFEAYKQIRKKENLVFCVPSGNFGNLTAGLLAAKMGLPIRKFIAATNVNDIVPSYLSNGVYQPKPSVPTISNAMDVGAPSNFRRMEDLYDHNWEDMTKDILGYSFTDDETRETIMRVKLFHNYVIDPHGAVGIRAAQAYLEENSEDQVIVLETAHPAKFLPVMMPLLGSVEIPERLSVLKDKEKKAVNLSKEYSAFKSWMLRSDK